MTHTVPAFAAAVPTIAARLFTASALIVLLLGAVHLLFTYRGTRFHPRDAALTARLQEEPLRITAQTTLWRAGIGFHASHSLGAMLFGLVYAYLANEPSGLLYRSPFLLTLGAVALAAWVGLAWRYWFSIPLRGLGVAAGCYAAALGWLGWVRVVGG